MKKEYFDELWGGFSGGDVLWKANLFLEAIAFSYLFSLDDKNNILKKSYPSFVIEEVLPDFIKLSRSDLNIIFFELNNTTGNNDNYFLNSFDKLVSNILTDINRNDSLDFFNKMLDRVIQKSLSVGDVYTPSVIVELMVSLISPKVGEKIDDPACGTGEFLISCINYLGEGSKSTFISGRDVNKQNVKIAKIRLLINNYTLECVEKKEGWNFSPRSIKSDVIITNPPFSLKNYSGGEESYIYGLPPKSNADYAFIQYVIFNLTINGRAAIIVPDGVLFRQGKEREIREKIVLDKKITTIISLPKGIFPGTAISANILLIDKGNKSEKIFMIDLSTSNNIDLSYIINLHNKKSETKYSKLVSIDEIRSNGFNLTVSKYFDEIKENEIINLDFLIKKQKKLEDKLNILQEEFYKLF
ncbi:N-6 DNA methylase [Leminorella grimontii]|uniref:N-6 DNA methylase n=1 Tax=Leminorella grimontii TaxID=82981 RepID=UPI00321FC48E